jgi:hypothetical protein
VPFQEKTNGLGRAMFREKVVVSEGHIGTNFPVNNKKRNTRFVQYPLAEKRNLGSVFDAIFKTEYAESVRPSHDQKRRQQR